MATELLPRSHPPTMSLLCFPRMRTSAPIQSRSRSHHQYMIQYTDRVHHRVPPSLPNDCGNLCTQHCPHSTASTAPTALPALPPQYCPSCMLTLLHACDMLPCPVLPLTAEPILRAWKERPARHCPCSTEEGGEPGARCNSHPCSLLRLQLWPCPCSVSADAAMDLLARPGPTSKSPLTSQQLTQRTRVQRILV